jgi:putative tricarboxylic transport membrane protein
VPFAPGGGSGITGETINKIFADEKLLSQPLAISYKPGAGGMIGWAYLTQNRGEPHVIATATSSLITGPLVTQAPVTYKDLTPIALMAVDGLLIVTGAESPYKTWDDIVSAAKASPKTINAGGTSASGSDAMAFAVLQKQQGFEITYIPFNSGGEVNAALLGNHVSLASGNPNELLPQIQANKMRPLLAITGKRIPALPDTPTATDKGVNLNLESGRGIVGPPDMPAAAQQIWVDAFKKATDSAGWKKYAEDNQMAIQFLGGDAYGTYMAEQTEMYTKIMQEMGISRS